MAPEADHSTQPLEMRGSMVRKWSSLGAHKRPCRTRLATLQPVFPCGLMRVKHEMPSVSPPEFTTLTHNDLLPERFLRWPRVCCSGLGATAHISGQNLLTFQVIYQIPCQPASGILA